MRPAAAPVNEATPALMAASRRAPCHSSKRQRRNGKAPPEKGLNGHNH